jgi:hypothetical protein
VNQVADFHHTARARSIDDLTKKIDEIEKNLSKPSTRIRGVITRDLLRCERAR